MSEPDYLGNRELLERQTIGFFGSRTTAPMSVLPTLDWAHEVARREDIAVMSGFQSPMEREVLSILLAGRCGIIMVLNRSIYRHVPELLLPVFDARRLLLVSLIPGRVNNPTRQHAAERNRYIALTAHSLVMSSVSPSSSLYPLLQEYSHKTILTL